MHKKEVNIKGKILPLKKMKRIVGALVLVLSIVACSAAFHNPHQNVPVPVLRSLSKQYSGVHIRGWKILNDTSIARFRMLKRKNSAFYLPNGIWIKTETKIPWSKDLPKAVNHGFNQTRFLSWYIDELKRIETPLGKTTYVIQVHYDWGPPESIPGDCIDVFRLFFDSSGMLLKETEIE